MDGTVWEPAAILAQVIQFIALVVLGPKTRRPAYVVILVTAAIATCGWAVGGYWVNAAFQLVVLVMVVIAILQD